VDLPQDLQKRVDLDVKEVGVLLGIGAFQPMHGFVSLAAKSVQLGDVKCTSARLIFEYARKSAIGFSHFS
jgi:hypothetical protein